jgi:Txe/YoeB family toxin of Txe-Axe toxin-antitoxin module
MIKPSKVVFISDELEEDYASLPEDDFLKKGITRAIQDLKQNAFSGVQIPKRLFPQQYIKKYGINNLWKYDLPKGWRLLYTVAPTNEVELISAILEWLPHKDYERTFKY